MPVSRTRISSLLNSYDKSNLTFATFCSHTSLQLFHGARLEGLKTLGIAIESVPKYYDAFALAKPDEFIVLKSYVELLDRADELAAKNVIIIPHGSFVEYLGPKNFENLRLPTFGNRGVLDWEFDREKERKWLEASGIDIPKRFRNPKEIDRPVMIKYYGAKGGKGFFIIKNYAEFQEIEKFLAPNEKYTIQEYVLGTRYYLHYFYSPLINDGYRLSKGSLELLGMDRRDEANIDEMYKLGSQEKLKETGIYPTFVVTGNVPVVLRESLLPKVFEMGERIVEKSFELFGGLIGPFCLETIVTDKLEFKVFEISCRIVAGTNIYISGSPYSDLITDRLSTGRRIAQELKRAVELNKLDMVVT